MSKITRAFQKIFGNLGASSNFGQFGSLAVGTPTTTKNTTTIQSLAAFDDGWQEATIGTFIPAYQDMNSLFYLAYYQICYILQMGIPEYDASTTYYTNSVCQSGGQIYTSLVDTNVGNTPASSPTQWQSGLPGAESVGVVKQYAGVVAPGGYLICDGAAINRTTYANLFAVIGTTYGIGDGSTTFNIPDLRTRVAVGYKSGDSTFGALGNSGGSKTNSHTHNFAHIHQIGVNAQIQTGGGHVSANDCIFQTDNQNTSTTGAPSDTNILQPYLTLNHIIKY